MFIRLRAWKNPHNKSINRFIIQIQKTFKSINDPFTMVAL